MHKLSRLTKTELQKLQNMQTQMLMQKQNLMKLKLTKQTLNKMYDKR